ncbi:TPA: hypothetical protein N0F65_006796 [Lagenidium giganteum]|uniref:Transcription elongation factor spt6 n=1 Tax=Lagenidium giganteum TaxID=4803 RepID=A0AAV2ZDI6_9STRA|nr:TPA: hypothetical protein N0F65_006796 [Lagenidium giganteum]
MSSDEESGGSPLISDSEEEVPKQSSKKRKVSKKESKKKKRSKKSKTISDSEDEDEKKSKSAFIEDMASESDDGEGDSDDDDDEDDGDVKNEYEQDGFVVDDLEEEDESDDDSGRHRRRRKKKEAKKLKRLKQKIEEIDDEDLRLVRENLGMDTGPTRSDSEDDELMNERSSKKRKDEDSGLMSRELSYRMFGDSDDEEESVPQGRNNNFLGNDDDYESDDLGEFIVDDDEENRGDGAPRRRRKQAPSHSTMMQGPSVYQMDEAEELFGDMGDFLEATRGATKDAAAANKPRKAILLEKFEPSVLKEHMMTPEMAAIREKDLSERYQQLFAGRQFPDAEDRAEESEWISDFIIKNMERRGQRTHAGSRGEIVSAIDSVLRFYHDERLEPPFVQRYCKEYWKPAGLHTEHLYEILDLDIKWDKLDRKRRSFQNGVQRVVDAAGRESRFVRECYQRLLRSPNEKAYQDLSEFLALDAPDSQGSGESSDRAYRRPVRRNFYQICMKGGLRPLAAAFTMNASVLGGIVAGNDCEESLRVIPTPEESPGIYAEKYTSKDFPTVDDVMKGARHIAACKVAAEPNVRKVIREAYRQNAQMFTEATQKGREDIDEFHYAHGLQYMMGMPVMEVFESGDMWLRLHRAEKEGLLTITIINEKAQDLLDPLEPIYMVSHADADEEWQTQRHLVLQEAVATIMVPSFENELKRDLLVASREVVVKECGGAIRKRLLVRPYELSEGVDPYVISIWVEGGMDSIAHVVALDANGEPFDKTQGLVKRDERHIQNLSNILFKFFQDNSKMHVVVINLSAGMKCMDMGELVDALRRQLGRGDASRVGNDDGRDYFEIVFLKDDVPSMYSRSSRAEAEFPEESEPVRAAIGLGRYLRNPASELCAMWGNVSLDEPLRGRELLYLNVHPLQHSLVKDMLLKEYDRVFVQVVNKFGVDINLLANHKHASYQLQFICGLGPVKAAAILERVRAKSYIERRQELLSNGFMGKVVYRNCAGFIRIRERDALKESPLNPLDDTRIHPESYYMAVKMCGDANDNSTIDMYDPKQYSLAVEDTMYQSASAIRSRTQHSANVRLGDSEIQDALSELDLPAYAQRLELQKKGPKLLTLEFIKRELRYPYFDKREKYQVPKDEELFFLLNGETKDTLRIGMIVPCTLLHMSGDFVRVRLQNGIRSVLRRDNLPDYMLEDPNFLKGNGFPKGITVNAKILNFKADPHGRFEIEIGCSSNNLRNLSFVNRDELSRYLNLANVENDSLARIDRLINRLAIEDEREEVRSTLGPPKRKKRQIAHPLFRNINCRTAMNYLREQPVGDVVIRPSTLGSNHLTLTWKMMDGVYRHFDIEERDKPSEARLGQKLVIKEEVYENIDELIARFVDPMNELVDDVLKYKYYKSMSIEEVHEELIMQKKAHPSRVPYILHVYSKFPGCFSITFIARVTPHSCHMEVKPGGFRFFGRIESAILPTLSQALQFFKMRALLAPNMGGSSTSRSANGSSSHQRDSTPFAQRPPSSSSYHNGRDSYGGGGSSYNDRPRNDSRQSSRWDDRRGGDNYSRGGGGDYGRPGGDDRRYHGSDRRNDVPVGGRRW